MDDVTRLFRALVKHLAEHDPRRLSAPFQISELYQSLVPYRLFKSELQFDSMEDYEMAVLRLLAGERGFVTLDPPDVQDVLRAECDAVMPDTGAFRDFANTLLVLKTAEVRGVLDEQSAYAPPGREEVKGPIIGPDGADPERTPDPAGVTDADVPESVGNPAPAGEGEASSSLVFEPVEPPDACPDCGRPLPTERAISFCPFCGSLVAPGTCVRCGATIEPTWRFCGICGQPASG